MHFILKSNLDLELLNFDMIVMMIKTNDDSVDTDNRQKKLPELFCTKGEISQNSQEK